MSSDKLIITCPGGSRIEVQPQKGWDPREPEEVIRLQREENRQLRAENDRLRSAGLALLNLSSTLHRALHFEETRPQHYAEPPEMVEARAALEVKR